MDKIFKKYKKLIDKETIKIASDLGKTNLDWSKEISKSLKETTLAGKGVRGSLILLTLDLFDKKIKDSDIKIASIIEYLHTALLIQDDIMDHDSYRRGLRTMHKKYEDLGRKLKVADSKDFGKSMAICIADVSIFYALEKLSDLKIDEEEKTKLFQIINHEFTLVGFGQIQDLFFSHLNDVPKSNQVLNMYQYKTARYTFSLPFTIGAILAKKDKVIINNFDKLGVHLGLIYQLTDDALTLNGSLDKVGKAIGNDISENKKTFYHVLLRKKANKNDLKVINQTFGKKKVSKKDIELVRNLIKKCRVNEIINDIIFQHVQDAEKIINNLKIKKEKKKHLFILIDYLLNRKK